MAGRDYMGIPREEIPWFPTIDTDLCSSCGSCLDFCTNNVFVQGDTSVQVINPYNCVVGCDACARDCPTNAISFPDKRELIQQLRQLREVYSKP